MLKSDKIKGSCFASYYNRSSTNVQDYKKISKVNSVQCTKVLQNEKWCLKIYVSIKW